jgi:hypothetical protein
MSKHDQPVSPATALGAYQAACRVMGRDGELGMDAEGILENVMAELAVLAEVRTVNGQPTPEPLTFIDLLKIDAIRRENHCVAAVCAYEAGCVCWAEFVIEKAICADDDQ